MSRSPLNRGTTTRSVIFAVGVHLLFLLAIGVSLNFSPHFLKSGGTPPVQATVVTESELQQELARINEEELQKEQEAERREAELERIREEARQLEEQRMAEEERLKQVEAERQAEEQRRL